MSKQKTAVISILLAGASMVAGYAIYQWTRPQPTPVSQQEATTQVKPVSIVGQKRPAFSLPDLQDKTRQISEWDGKVVLLNFWATWCPPCRREMPAFIELQDKYGKQGFQVVGLAIDRKEPVIDFSDGIGVNYPILHGETAALEISADYGNRLGQLPYSVIIDRNGVIRYVKRGELTHKEADEQITKLLQ